MKNYSVERGNMREFGSYRLKHLYNDGGFIPRFASEETTVLT